MMTTVSAQHELTDIRAGLTQEEVKERLAKYGHNEIAHNRSEGIGAILLRQFQSTVIVLLLIASLLSLSMHEYVQAVAIFLAVFLNAFLGFVTEFQAKVSLDSLENVAGPTCRVVRDGQQQEIPVNALVPGDVVVLELGSRVPADLVLVEAVSLSFEESMLSGESIPVYKKTLGQESGADDQAVMAYHGSMVLSGRGLGVVQSTGSNTSIGKLGKLLSQTYNERTPLENKLEELGKQLSWLTVFLCLILVLLSLARRLDLWLTLQTSIALAVAAIPEGMPAIATLALAVGTKRMIKNGALVRKLAAVETLGCTTVICSDKTGTLTENQMMVTDLILPMRHLKVSGQGYNPVGEFSEDGAVFLPEDDFGVVELLRCASLCNDARLENHGDVAAWHVHGDPTEGAILAAAAKLGIRQEDLLLEFPRHHEVPFDLLRKRMSTVHQIVGAHEDSYLVCVKGSPGTVIALSTELFGSAGEMSAKQRAWFIEQNEMLAAQGLRVLAVASKRIPAVSPLPSCETIESDLTLLGLVAMADQERQGVKSAIELCHDAGIKVIMVTGDQPLTARAVGLKLGILDSADADSERCILSGRDLEEMSEDQIVDALRRSKILARVSPQLKLKVVRRLQQMGEVVAMTGDGVNDAPALRQANIGVAMGRGGTDLAREAANMVITDDNFFTITKAVEQGRIVYSNIRKAIAYLLTASLASVMTVFTLVLMGDSAPFSPLQLLWLNLIMHVFPGLGLVLQPAGVGIMDRAPRSPAEPLLSPGIRFGIISRSVFATLSVLLAMKVVAFTGAGDLHTVGFATLSLSLILQTFSWAFSYDVDRRAGGKLRENQLAGVLSRPVLVNVGISFALLLVALYCAPVQKLLGTNALNSTQCLIVASCALLAFLFSFIRFKSGTQSR